MSKQIFDTSGIVHPTVTTSAPTGAVGISFAVATPYANANQRKISLTLVVSSAPSDIFIWTSRAAGVSGDATDDVWGLFQDMFGIVKLGKLASALPIGTYHFIIPDVGPFSRIYIQSSAGTVVATVAPIQEVKNA